jgi:HD-GYP domain-containing protein (c-di-GMP phosphodiesterase class II)
VSEVSGQNALMEHAVNERAPGVKRQPYHTFSELLIPLSSAIDLAEARTPGHAQRVAFISMALAEGAGLDGRNVLSTVYTALLHDIGTIPAGAGMGAHTRGDERLLFAALPLLTPEEAAVGMSDSPEVVVERVVDHVIHGARTVQDLGLAIDVVKGVSAHHESWNGTGYPHGLRGEEIPIIGRIVALADQIESMIEQSTPLLARRNFIYWVNELSGKEADPALCANLRDLGAGDRFWLDLFSESLPAELSYKSGRLREPKGVRIEAFLDHFAQLVDSRFSFTVGVSSRVARLAESLGKATGMAEPRLRLLRIAALLHDVGQLAVSERIMSKPGILSVEELEVLRLHPVYSRDVVAGIPGLDEVAEWVVAHHERIDGKGYPDGRPASEIPTEARILAIADAFVAITSDRPHREKATPEDARRRLRSAAGTQLDADLVDVFLKQVAV